MRTFKLAVASEGITLTRTPACIIVGAIESRSIEFHMGLMFGEMLHRQIGALRLLERAHPFGNFIVLLDLGELLEIAPDNRIGLRRAPDRSPVFRWPPPDARLHCRHAAWKRGPMSPSR